MPWATIILAFSTSMTSLFATPGMTAFTIPFLIVEILSFLVLWIILLAFRRVVRKQRELFLVLHDAPPTLARHTVLMWFYIIMTVVIGVVSTSLFLFEPHLL